MAVTSSKRDTRVRILTAGVDLASEAGLTAVTMGTLAERAELSKSGLFAHFASRMDLQLQLLQATEDILTQQVVQPALAVEPGAPRLRMLMHRWLGWFRRAGLSGGCPLFAAAFEFDDQPGPVRDYLVEGHHRWMKLLTTFARDVVDSDDAAAQLAFQLNGVYLAHHVAERLAGDSAAERQALLAVEALLAPFSSQPPGPNREPA